MRKEIEPLGPSARTRQRCAAASCVGGTVTAVDVSSPAAPADGAQVVVDVDCVTVASASTVTRTKTSAPPHPFFAPPRAKRLAAAVDCETVPAAALPPHPFFQSAPRTRRRCEPVGGATHVTDVSGDGTCDEALLAIAAAEGRDAKVCRVCAAPV